MADYDVIVIGAGPGGYVAAIKAAQAGLRAAIVEREHLGGICLNWGCIPTKALLKSAEVWQTIQHAEAFGLACDNPRIDFAQVMARSREVADGMQRGIGFLMKKNQIEVLHGTGSLVGGTSVKVVAGDGTERTVSADNVIIASGHQPRTFPHLPIDGRRVITYRHALALETLPERVVCIGAGAIGMEFGFFWNALGARVTVVEVVDRVLPNEDGEVSAFVAKAFRKQGIDIRLETRVTALDAGDDAVGVTLQHGDTSEVIEVDAVLVAVGFQANTHGLGLAEAGVELDDRGFIRVDQHQRTTAAGIYAIGDVCGRQLLAHKASFEGEAAIGHLCGHPAPVDYDTIPGCTYCQPQVASLGLSEEQAKAKGIDYVVGRFQFLASGKAKAIGHDEGFVKLLFEKDFMQLIGAHITGYDATELLGELSTAYKLESTARELMESVHAHPTLSEAVMEAAADALGLCVHQ